MLKPAEVNWLLLNKSWELKSLTRVNTDLQLTLWPLVWISKRWPFVWASPAFAWAYAIDSAVGDIEALKFVCFELAVKITQFNVNWLSLEPVSYIACLK